MQRTVDILMIEDEIEVLEGLRAALRLQEAGSPIGHVFTTGNAEDAKEIITALSPRIIVTDIVLPRMSGLDLLKFVSELPGYDPKIIVMSSYGQFEYAQRSIQLGALDYVLKPFDKTEFSQRLRNLAEAVAREDAERSRLRHEIEHARMGAKLLIDQYMLSFCMKKTILHEHIYHRLQLWNLTWLTTSAYHVATFCVSGEMPERDKEIELQLFAVGNVALETVQNFKHSYVVRNVHNRWILASAHDRFEELTDAIRENVLRYQRLDLLFGVSNPMHSFQSLADGYEQATQALRFASLNSAAIAYYGELYALPGEERTGSPNEAFAEAFLSGDRAGMEREIASKLDGLVRYSNVLYRKQLAQACLDWITELQAFIYEKSGFAMENISLSLWERIESFPSLEALRSMLADYFQTWSAKAAAHAAGMGNAIIGQAKAIIAESDDVTLQRVAERLAIHPVWLSHLFKKETGQNFSDYLIDLRMEKAKSLLRDSNLKVYEIAETVGYQDLQHFGKMFKKRTGMSPKEYRYGR